MKHLKKIALATMATTLLALAAGTASATTLEVNGVTKNGSVSLTLSLKASTSLVTTDTFGFSSNTCRQSHMHGNTTSATSMGPSFPITTHGSYTGEELTAPLTAGSNGLSFAECDRNTSTHTTGTLHIRHIAGTTNGTVTSSGAEYTTGSPFGTLNCKTGTGTHLGTMAGVKEGHVSLAVRANLSCSGISSVFEGNYTVTSPTGLGVSA